MRGWIRGLELNRWSALQAAVYVVVPIATLVLYVFGMAWCVGRYS